MRHLTLIYDAECGLCSRLATWLGTQPVYFPLYLVPSARAARVHPALTAEPFRDELVAVSDEGSVWVGNHAWILCLHALKDYRGWAQRLSRPALLPFARQAFAVLSDNRRSVSKWLGHITDSELETQLRPIRPPICRG